MLSEMMLAGVPTERPSIKEGEKSGLYISGFHPCPYRMYLVHTGGMYPEERGPQEVLVMEDGKDQGRCHRVWLLGPQSDPQLR